MIIKKHLYIILLIFFITNNIIVGNDSFLPALIHDKNNDKLFSRTRDLNTVATNSSDFDYIFPNTDKSCGYILRYFFRTNIYLNQNSNTLVSMDGDNYSLGNESYFPNNKDYIIKLCRDVINKISLMHFGSQELNDFLDSYPVADI
tara:strand:- start:529 stop:966 length:438 start_codon:yes stop_codon:yes gene_type:complete